MNTCRIKKNKSRSKSAWNVNGKHLLHTIIINGKEVSDFPIDSESSIFVSRKEQFAKKV